VRVFYRHRPLLIFTAMMHDSPTQALFPIVQPSECQPGELILWQRHLLRYQFSYNPSHGIWCSWRDEIVQLCVVKPNERSSLMSTFHTSPHKAKVTAMMSQSATPSGLL
jgi:hypothetical protein